MISAAARGPPSSHTAVTRCRVFFTLCHSVYSLFADEADETGDEAREDVAGVRLLLIVVRVSDCVCRLLLGPH